MPSELRISGSWGRAAVARCRIVTASACWPRMACTLPSMCRTSGCCGASAIAPIRWRSASSALCACNARSAAITAAEADAGKPARAVFMRAAAALFVVEDINRLLAGISFDSCHGRLPERPNYKVRNRAAHTAAFSAAAILFIQALVQRLVRDARLALAPQLRLERIVGGRQLVAHFQEVCPARRVERAAVERRAHRTAGFVAVRAIAEAALQRERF